MPDFAFHLRLATPADIPALRELISASVLGLQAGDYTRSQLEAALRTVYGVDTQLIADGTYFVVEARGETPQDADTPHAGASASDESTEHGAALIVACGGWSKRKTLYGGDQWSGREPELLDPAADAAKIRAFFVHPGWARRGIGTIILNACEQAAIAAGFTRLEMGATLTGVPMYRARGYTEIEPLSVPLDNGESLPIVRMGKSVSR